MFFLEEHPSIPALTVSASPFCAIVEKQSANPALFACRVAACSASIRNMTSGPQTGCRAEAARRTVHTCPDYDYGIDSKKALMFSAD